MNNRQRDAGQPWETLLPKSLSFDGPNGLPQNPQTPPHLSPSANRASQAKGFLRSYRMLPALGPLKKQTQKTQTPVGPPTASLATLPLETQGEVKIPLGLCTVKHFRGTKNRPSLKGRGDPGGPQVACQARFMARVLRGKRGSSSSGTPKNGSPSHGPKPPVPPSRFH